jgi:hypothetical protein
MGGEKRSAHSSLVTTDNERARKKKKKVTEDKSQQDCADLNNENVGSKTNALPSTIVQESQCSESGAFFTLTSFDTLTICEPLKNALKEMKMTHLTEIQV